MPALAADFRRTSTAILWPILAAALCAQTVVQPNGSDTHSPIAPHTNLDLQRSFGLHETNLPGKHYESTSGSLFGRTATVFFPPPLPVLGQIEPSNAYDGLRVWPAEHRERVVELVGEPFYMPFASLLWNDQLSAKRLQRIQHYLASRHDLVRELRSKLADVKNTGPSSRGPLLAQFAESQAGRLRQLEDEAEAIRTDLTTGGLFRTADTGTHVASLSRATDRIPVRVAPDYIGAMEAAQFRAGLSGEQRLLLHEIGLERQTAHAASPASPPPETDAVFFLPATARIRMAQDLPANIQEKLARFEREKRALKDELWAVAGRDDDRTIAQRTAGYSAVAVAQAPHFAALETLAEEIRGDLAPLHYPGAPEAANLPSDLARRVGIAVNRKTAAQRELTARVRALRHDLPADRVEIGRRGEGLAIMVHPGGKASRVAPQTRARILAAVEAFNDDFAARYSGLAGELSALRGEIQAYASARSTGRPVSIDDIAIEFSRSYTAQETWKRFDDYRAAVLEPGLSPAQRRLLYRAALSELAKVALAGPLFADAAQR